MTPNPSAKMSHVEYFEYDKNAEGNFEYFDGALFEMSGVTVEHSTLEINLAQILNPTARFKGCRSFSASFHIKPPAILTYRYPDFSVVCGRPEFVTIGGVECLTNPTLIIEILSESTEKFDRGDKFLEYKSIPSFREYVLISSTAIRITLFQKHNERFWLQSDYKAGESFHLNTLDLDLEVDELYQAVDFSTATDG